jgi:endonuclease III
MSTIGLTDLIDGLLAKYGELRPPPISDPFELILYENVSYLVDDDHRLKAYRNLERTIGTLPEDILSASPEQFGSVVEMAGSDKIGRVANLVTCAEIAIREFGGNVRSSLELPFKKALGPITRFPSIGEPSGEKILLFCGVGEVLPLDSNGLRVMTRLGFGSESSNYSETYRTVRESLAGQFPIENRWLISAHLLLRKHGQMMCKSNHPECDQCPVVEKCDFGRVEMRKIYAN